MPVTQVIIVNYRTASLVIDCLRSLQSEVEADPGIRVAVIDNESGDSSLAAIQEFIARQGWSWVSAEPACGNHGFAAGNNEAIRRALAEPHPPAYFHLLNPDTLVWPGAVRALVAFMEAHPQVGIAGSALEDPDGTPQASAFRFHGVWSELDRGLRLGIVTRLLPRYTVVEPMRKRPHPTDWVSGASMMIRRDVFEDIGLLDDQFFLYYEETDFCMRARRAGWSVWHVPFSRVIHLEGQSTGLAKGGQSSKPVPRYWFASRRRYFRKHHGAGYEFLVNAVHAFGYALWSVRNRLQGKANNDPPNYLRDFCRYGLFGQG